MSQALLKALQAIGGRGVQPTAKSTSPASTPERAVQTEQPEPEPTKPERVAKPEPITASDPVATTKLATREVATRELATRELATARPPRVEPAPDPPAIEPVIEPVKAAVRSESVRPFANSICVGAHEQLAGDNLPRNDLPAIDLPASDANETNVAVEPLISRESTRPDSHPPTPPIAPVPHEPFAEPVVRPVLASRPIPDQMESPIESLRPPVAPTRPGHGAVERPADRVDPILAPTRPLESSALDQSAGNQSVLNQPVPEPSSREGVESLLGVPRDRQQQSLAAEEDTIHRLRESIQHAPADVTDPDEEAEHVGSAELDTDDIQDRLTRFVHAEPASHPAESQAVSETSAANKATAGHAVPAKRDQSDEPDESSTADKSGESAAEALPTEDRAEPTGSGRPQLQDGRFVWTPGQGTAFPTDHETKIAANLRDEQRSAQYRELADNLVREFSANTGAVVMFVGADNESHIAEVVAHVGTLLASRDRGEILLVDGRADHKTLSHNFGRVSEPGVSDILHSQKTWQEFVHPTATDRLKLLPHGDSGLGERENERAVLGRLFEEFKSPFRFTLIDAGGAGDAFARIAGRSCDAAYLIVQLGMTNTNAARSALGAMYSEGARVLGCVVTNHP